MRQNFEKLAGREDWADPNSQNSPKKFTLHRQKQLAVILKKYGGKAIPLSHFTDDITDNPAKRNQYAFPVVFAYLCGILKIKGENLVMPEGLVLGKRAFDRNEVHWIE